MVLGTCVFALGSLLLLLVRQSFSTVEIVGVPSPDHHGQGNYRGRETDETPSRLNQFLCGLRGHDGVLHFEGNRVMMRCTSCQHDSPGWEINGRAPRQRFEGDPARHVLKVIA